jgi:hypothetical protein
MATSWDSVTYPLTDRTTFEFSATNKIDKASDNTVFQRTLTSKVLADLRVEIAPLSEAESATFQTLATAIPATEWSIPHNGKTYTGYIDTGTLRKAFSGGILHVWTFTLVGAVT